MWKCEFENALKCLVQTKNYEKVLFLSIEGLANISIKVPFQMQITKKDIAIP